MGKSVNLAAALTGSNQRIAAVGVAAFVVAGSVKFAVVGLLLNFGVHRKYLRLQDAALTGALAALLVSSALIAMAARRRYVLQQIQVVSNLNHELRNALEVILGSEYLPQSAQAEAILESVNRIERTLVKVLGSSRD